MRIEVLQEAYERQAQVTFGLVEAISDVLPLDLDAERAARLRGALLDARAQVRAIVSVLERENAEADGA